VHVFVIHLAQTFLPIFRSLNNGFIVHDHEGLFLEIFLIVYYFQVSDDQLVIKDSSGTFVETQFMEIDNITLSLRKFYVEAYIGSSLELTPKYWLIFQASAPPLGWNSYYISRQTLKGRSSQTIGQNKLR
jgi:hypothetical protein